MRDALQIAADACNEQIENLAPPEVKNTKDFDALFWEDRMGAKGPFQQTTKKSNKNCPTFQALQKILLEHGGFSQVGDYRYWNNRKNPDVIDRRKK